MRYAEIMERGLARIREAGMADQLDLGAETHSQNRLNRTYTDSLVFTTRLFGSTPADTATSLFGRPLPLPVMASAMCLSRVLERVSPGGPYLEEIASGLAAAGTFMSTGHIPLDQLARIVDQGAPVVHIVKPYTDDDMILAHLRRAEALGCVAVGMDIDCMFKEKAHDEVPGPDFLTHKSVDQIHAFCLETRLPFIVKGVLSVEDAQIARDIGAAAVMVSNHGGEVIDYSVPVLKALPDVRATVPDLVVLADSGFRRGTDILKALALGADGVGIVTLLLIAYAAGGKDGVTAIVEAVQEELARTMSYVGCPTVPSIDGRILDRVEQL